MADEGLVYTVKDRSFLLPIYKNFFVTPLLPFIPERVHPNAITHVGHVINLLGVVLLFIFFHDSSPSKVRAGFVAAAFCLHVYNWCDNADGAHARRTNRASATGEWLDHGLDIMNTTYIAYVSAIAIGAPQAWWIAIALVVPAGCAATYWEQAETGVLHLGTLGQIESLCFLSAVLLVSAWAGVDVWERVRVGPFSARLAIMSFVCAGGIVTIIQNVARVLQARGVKRILRIAPLVFIQSSTLVAALLDVISPLCAVVIGTFANIFFGVRSLAVRTASVPPTIELRLVVFCAALVCLIAWRLAGGDVGPVVDVTASLAALFVFGTSAARNARDTHRAVARLDSHTTYAASGARAKPMPNPME